MQFVYEADIDLLTLRQRVVCKQYFTDMQAIEYPAKLTSWLLKTQEN